MPLSSRGGGGGGGGVRVVVLFTRGVCVCGEHGFTGVEMPPKS